MSSPVNLTRFLRTFYDRTHPVAASVTNLVNHIILSVFYIFVFFFQKRICAFDSICRFSALSIILYISVLVR